MKTVNKIFIFLAVFISIAFHVISPVRAYDCPATSASSAILIEAQNGDVIFESNADERRPIASTTKILTALVVLNKANLSDVITVDENAVGVEGSSVYLRAGEKLTVEELLYAMLLNSANDAAAALAIGCFGSIEQCAAEMNAYALSLGMTNSHFDNPHGLDSATHYSTARDMATLGRMALENSQFAKIVSTYKKNIPLCSNEGVRILINHNRLLNSLDGAIGIKTGFTKKSGRCLVSAAERNGVRLIAVTLNDPDDWRDHSKMYDLGFEYYKNYSLIAPEEYSYDVDIFGGEYDKLPCKNETGFSITQASDLPAPYFEIDVPRYLIAPIKEGEQIGSINIYQSGEIIAEIPIKATKTVEAINNHKGFLERLFSFIK